MAEEAKGAVRALEASERRDRVLIVEDEDNARKGYEQLLQRWGCEVLGVSNAEDALAKFATFHPDALIADVVKDSPADKAGLVSGAEIGDLVDQVHHPTIV